MAAQSEPAQRGTPRRRSGHTTTVTISGEQVQLTANAGADGSLGEVFIHWGKQGSGTAGLADIYAGVLSLGLRHRVPLAELIRHGLGLRFSPAGHTDDPDIPRARSVVDYVARRLAIDWLPYDERAELGVYTLTERLHEAAAWLASAAARPVPSRPPPGTDPAAPPPRSHKARAFVIIRNGDGILRAGRRLSSTDG